MENPALSLNPPYYPCAHPSTNAPNHTNPNATNAPAASKPASNGGAR